MDVLYNLCSATSKVLEKRQPCWYRWLNLDTRLKAQNPEYLHCCRLLFNRYTWIFLRRTVLQLVCILKVIIRLFKQHYYTDLSHDFNILFHSGDDPYRNEHSIFVFDAPWSQSIFLLVQKNSNFSCKLTHYTITFTLCAGLALRILKLL